LFFEVHKILEIDIIFSFTAEAQRTQRKDAFLLLLRGQQKKKIIRYAIFLVLNAPRDAPREFFLLFFVLSTKNNKKENSAFSATLMSEANGR
jgi:hypothetical protein